MKLVAEGSPLVLSLKLLEKLGIRLVACQTCLGYYGLEDKVVVGQVGGIKEIARLMAEAEKVIAV